MVQSIESSMPDEDAHTERTSLLSNHTARANVNGDTRGHEATKEDESAGSIGSVHGISIVICLWLLVFLQASNVSLLTTTQSAIADDLNAFSETSWFSSAYMIGLSAFTPLGGRMSKIFTPNIYITVSCAVFTVGSVISAVATSLSIFLLGRATTGIGGAGIFSVTLVLVLEHVSEKRRGLFLGLINTGFTVGIALGAVIAGVLAPRAGWRAVFWVQAPVALLLGAIIYSILPQLHGNDAGSMGDRHQLLSEQLMQVDYLGILTLVSSIVLLLFGLSSLKIMISPIILSGAIFALFIFIEGYHAQNPIIPVTLLKSRGVLLSSVANLGLMTARWTVLFYTPIYSQAVRLWSPATAGVILVPTNAGFAVGGLISGWIHIRKAGNYYFSSIASIFLFGISQFALAQLSTAQSSTTAYVIATFANGFFTGACLNYTLIHQLHLIPKDLHVIATPMAGMFRSFAGSFGSSIGGGIFFRELKSSLQEGFNRAGLSNDDDLLEKLLGSPALVKNLGEPMKTIAMDSYATSIRNLFLAGTVLALMMTLFQAGTGWTGYDEGVLRRKMSADGDGDDGNDDGENDDDDSVRERPA